MKWLEVTIITSKEFADIISLALIELGSEGTVIRDSSDTKELLKSGVIWDYVDEDLLKNVDPRVYVSGFFTTEFDISKIADKISAMKEGTDFETGSLEISVNEINSQDWENEWKKYYIPIEFSSFAIVPEWIKNHGITNKSIIKLNPGMAFGTGSHETTNMCLKLMDTLCLKDKTVIDVGCGSGILGITAAALGAKKCLLTDIDPYAIKCAKENAEKNGLSAKTEIVEADLLGGMITERGDVLTANLTAPILLKAREDIKKHLVNGASVIISGILKDYDNEVLSSYMQDFDIVLSLADGDWRAHLLRLKTTAR